MSKIIIDHYHTILDKVRLEESVEAFAYVNSFIVYFNKLEVKKKMYTK